MTGRPARRIILLGPPGSGKGTQAELLGGRLGVPVLGTGDILRAEAARGTELGRRAKGYMDSGRLVPDDLIMEMMSRRMAQADARAGFILDGFPRSAGQAEGLERILEKLGTRIERVVEISVGEEEIVARLSGRRVCSRCGRVENVKAGSPGRCEACGGELARRSDDDPETIRRRLRVYRASTEPLAGYYEARGLLRRVDGTGPIDEVFGRILRVLADGAGERADSGEGPGASEERSP